MPARLIEPVARDLKLGGSSQAARNLQQNQVVLYEHKDFEQRGRIRLLVVTEHQPQRIFSLHVMDFKDCMSSLRWNLPEGVVVQFHEHHDGGGRLYQIWGSGQDADVHNNGFGDKASSWSWYRTSG